MIKVCLESISALSKPRTAASTATELSRFFGSAALGTPLPSQRGCTRHDGCFCGHASVNMTQITPALSQLICTLGIPVLGVIAALETAAMTLGDEAARLTDPAALVASTIAVHI